MGTISNSCVNIQKSLKWCDGTPVYAGIMRRIYYIAKSSIVKWPTLIRATDGVRAAKAKYSGEFTLGSDQKWKCIDIIQDKSQFTSEPQGEFPSQTQLNKLTAVHPGVDEEASSAAAYLNNNDNVFIVQDMNGNYRVVGSEKWFTKTTVTQDNGQGASGTASTTINVEASDEVPSPFYDGVIETEDGDINASVSA